MTLAGQGLGLMTSDQALTFCTGTGAGTDAVLFLTSKPQQRRR